MNQTIVQTIHLFMISQTGERTDSQITVGAWSSFSKAVARPHSTSTSRKSTGDVDQRGDDCVGEEEVWDKEIEIVFISSLSRGDYGGFC